MFLPVERTRSCVLEVSYFDPFGSRKRCKYVEDGLVYFPRPRVKNAGKF
jgi:hypothetical protein